MELDDLKQSWEGLNNEVEKKQPLSNKMIDQMTRDKYYASLKRIALPEIIGAIVCLAGATFILVNFSKLNSFFWQAAGIVSIQLLLILPTISLLSIWNFKIKTSVNNTYAETLRNFAIQKKRFYTIQKVNITLSYLLLVSIIILLPKFFGGKDISDNKYFWILAFPLGYLFLLFFSRWVFKHYKKTLQQAEELFRELGS